MFNAWKTCKSSNGMFNVHIFYVCMFYVRHLTYVKRSFCITCLPERALNVRFEKKTILMYGL